MFSTDDLPIPELQLKPAEPIADVVKNAKLNFTFPRSNISILIFVDGHEVSGKVSAEAMALASPVWEKFIYPPWRVEESIEEDFTTPKEEICCIPKSSDLVCSKEHPVSSLDFSEDNAQALLTLLRIVHFDFGKIPKKVSAEQIYQLAILVDQYQCVKLLRPFLPGWLEKLAKNPRDKLGERESFVWWAFGMENSFRRYARERLLNSRVDEDGKYLTEHGMPIGDVSTAPMFTETILSQRLVIIQQLLSIPYTLLHNLTSKIPTPTHTIPDNQRKQWCICDSSVCDSMAYGSLLITLKRHALYPQKTAYDIRGSISELADDITKMDINTAPDDDRIWGSHETCRMKSKFQRKVEIVLGGVQDPILECHLRHMEEQREDGRYREESDQWTEASGDDEFGW